MTGTIQILHTLLSDETEHLLKVVLMTLNSAETLEGNSVTVSKTRKDKRTFLPKFHII